MSQQKGITFKEFRQRFQAEEACEAYLFEQRWPMVLSAPNAAAVMDIGCPTDDTSVSNAAIRHR